MWKQIAFMKQPGKPIALLKKTTCWFMLTLFLAGVVPARALTAEEKVPTELQAKLFLTALTYDKNLQTNVHEKLTIGIVFFPGTIQSKETAQQFSKALEKFKDKKVSGRTINSVVFAYQGNNKLKGRVAREGINVMYISSGEKDVIQDVLQVCTSEKVFSLGCSARSVLEYSVSMAIGIKANKPKIYLNLASAKAEGSNFSSKFLRVVKIVDNR
jgi:hypothetical protein